MEIPVFNTDGQKIDMMQLSEEKFGGPVREKLLREAVIMYEANKRQGTASTKTKAEVAGGGRKPWTQKHTGRARVGSIRSPLWRGGGVVFGPKPRKYSYSMPKKARRLALFSAMAAKIRDGELVVVEDIRLDYPKTSEMVRILKSLGINGESCLIVLSTENESVLKSARNIPYVMVRRCADLNAYDVLRHTKILMTRDALSGLENRSL